MSISGYDPDLIETTIETWSHILVPQKPAPGERLSKDSPPPCNMGKRKVNA